MQVDGQHSRSLLQKGRMPSVMLETSVGARIDASLDRLESATAQASGAVLDVCRERARDRAAFLGRLSPSERGPLHGVPFLAKGNMAVAGEPNHGMGPYSFWTAAADAGAIQELEGLGAVLVGRSNFPELSLSASEADNNPNYARVLNPWDSARTIGGSSSGSAAAVALGLVPLALGTDTGGSVRIPAAFAGIPGIKPTHDLFTRTGVLPVSWTLDQVGLLAEDVTLIRTAIASMLGKDWTVPSPGVKRLGVVRDVTAGFHRSHPDIDNMLDDAAAQLAAAGWVVSEVTGTEFLTCQPAVSGIINVEAARSHGPANEVGGEPFGESVMKRMKSGASVGEEFYLAALASRQGFRARLLEVFESVDVLLLATVPFPAPLIEELPLFDAGEHAILTRLPNITGVPAVTVPGAWTGDGLPLGCQFVASHGKDLIALEAAAMVSRTRL